MHSLSGRIHNKLIILIISEEEKLVARVKSGRELVCFFLPCIFLYILNFCTMNCNIYLKEELLLNKSRTYSRLKKIKQYRRVYSEK